MNLEVQTKAIFFYFHQRRTGNNDVFRQGTSDSEGNLNMEMARSAEHTMQQT